jgi:hypothetical protein
MNKYDSERAVIYGRFTFVIGAIIGFIAGVILSALCLGAAP